MLALAPWTTVGTDPFSFYTVPMEQRTFGNVTKYLNTNFYSYLETSGDQSYYMYLNLVHLFNTGVN
jgi:hypothetical protein